MAIIKRKELANMSKEEIEKKLQDLKFELIRASSTTSKTRNIKEIKKTIAKLNAAKKSKKKS